MAEETAVAGASSIESPVSLADLLNAPSDTGQPESTTPGATQGDTGDGGGEEQFTQGDAEVVETDAEQAPQDEADIAPDEGETDYSDEVYARYANHFKQTKGVELNPEDPAHRALLQEVIQRGENFRRLQAEQAAAAEAGEDVESEPEQAAAPVVDTPETVQAFLSQIDKLSEARVRPEVAKVFLNDFLVSLWGPKGKQLADNASPEAAKAFTKTMTKFGYLFLNDALPEILNNYVPGLVANAYPGLDTATRDTVYEQAVEKVSATHPEVYDLIENDAFDEVYEANPWLRDTQFRGKDGRNLSPIENETRRLQIALSLAGGKAPAPELLRGAVEQGRQQVRRANNTAALGRLAPGESGGAFNRSDDEATELIKDMASQGDRDRQIQDLLAPKPTR